MNGLPLESAHKTETEVHELNDKCLHVTLTNALGAQVGFNLNHNS